MLLRSESHGPEAIMTTIPESTGRRTTEVVRHFISVPLHHHFVIQHRLMSGT
jgi:hypothetical protein